MRVSILTLFPEYFSSVLSSSMLGRAVAKGLVEWQVVDIRAFATDKHQTTDDRPFGGGAGMVMKVEPIAAALSSVVGVTVEELAERVAKRRAGGSVGDERIFLTSAKGAAFTQATAQEWAGLQHLILICGHYEGVDERVAEHLCDGEVRIGDFVLTGGEPAAAVIADAVVRLLLGVLGNEESTQGESHSSPGFMSHPQYTRPEKFGEWEVPSVLLSGHQKRIEEWRKTTQKNT
jgi:tRNA (guanine37-N1)-methyltransferase